MTDPWGNPLPSDDRPPASPRPEDYPPSFPTMPPGPPEPPPPAPHVPPAPGESNPAWPGKHSSAEAAPPPASHPQSTPPLQGPPTGAPVPPQYYPAPPYPAPPYPPQAWPKASAMAIASLVCGLAGLVCFGIVLAPTAFGLGLAARRSIRSSNGWRTGDGMAIAGIVLGIIGTILAIVTMVYVLKNPDYLDNFFNTTTTVVDTGLKGA